MYAFICIVEFHYMAGIEYMYKATLQKQPRKDPVYITVTLALSYHCELRYIVFSVIIVGSGGPINVFSSLMNAIIFNEVITTMREDRTVTLLS